MENQGGNLPASLEGKLGGRLTVWIGAVALALGGVFLVKYSIDQGWINPQTRVISGLIAGLLMAIAAWKLRTRSSSVAQGLAAAAVADIFACTWAAVNLYQMIPPVAGFAIMASTAAAAAFMSRGLGPIVAVVGLLGGFITPLLLPGNAPAWQLFGYFLLIQAGTEALARKRGQEWLSMIGLAAGSLWALAYLMFTQDANAAFWLSGFGTLSFLLYALSGQRGAADGRLVLATASGVLSLLLGFVVLGRADYAPEAWLLFGVASAAVLAVARLRDDFAPLVWVAAVGSTFAVIRAVWHTGSTGEALVPAVIVSCTFGLTSLCSLGSARPRHWLVASGMAASVSLLALWFRRQNTMEHLAEGSLGISASIAQYLWPALFLGVAAMLAGSAVAMLRTRRADAWIPLLYANLLVFLAWPLELDAEWFTPLWALQLPLLMLQARRLDSMALRGVATALAAVVFVSFGLNYGILNYEILHSPLFNWIAPAFGAAIGGLIVTRSLLPHAALQHRNLYAIAAAWLGLAGLLLEVRHIWTMGDMNGLGISTYEMVAYACVAMVYGAALVRLLAGKSAVRQFGEVVLILGALFSLLGVGFVQCPLVTHEAVGEWPMFNMLAVQYLLPGVVLAGAIIAMNWRAARELRVVLGVFAGLQVAAWVGLSIRHAFHGSQMWLGGAAPGEHLAYSLAMAAGAVALLAWGLRTKHRGWRIAGLAAIGVCTCKVFLFDASATEGLYRALSFMGLGVSLMGLGYLYNRFVIRDFAPSPVAATPQPVPSGVFAPVPAANELVGVGWPVMPRSTGEPAPGTPDSTA